MRKFILGIFALLLLSSFVSAGVGIKWDQESVLVDEGDRTCLIYQVYNPWPEATYVTIELSKEIKDILVLQEVDTKLIPAQTFSNMAIPVKFCFIVPQVYKRDCLVGSFLCKSDCSESQKVYSGEVMVKSVNSPDAISGAGGSGTTMTVSAPLRINVQCTQQERSYLPVYVLIGGISFLIVMILIVLKYRKPKIERDRDKLRRLQEEIKREQRGSSKSSGSKVKKAKRKK